MTPHGGGKVARGWQFSLREKNLKLTVRAVAIDSSTLQQPFLFIYLLKWIAQPCHNNPSHHRPSSSSLRVAREKRTLGASQEVACYFAKIVTT